MPTTQQLHVVPKDKAVVYEAQKMPRDCEGLLMASREPNTLVSALRGHHR